MKKNKIYIIFVGFTVILFTVVLGMLFVSINAEPELQTPQRPNPTIATAPTSAPQRSAIHYDEASEEKLLEIIRTRPELSENDKAVKAKILRVLPRGEVSGIIYSSLNITIDYVNSANVFQVEILTPKISEAKDEAIVWFTNQGMSQEGICNAPVVFYVNYYVAEELREQKINFSTLAQGC